MKRATDEDQHQRAHKRFKPDFLDITTVLVGENEDRFMVHTSNICEKSPFFNAACSNRWKEGQEKTVKLPKIKPHVFKIYLNWVYSGQIDIELVEHPPTKICRDSHDHSRDPDSEETRLRRRCGEASRTRTYCELYVAADLLLDQGAKLEIIDSWVATNQFVTPCTVEFVWQNTPRGCGLQRFILDLFATRATPNRQKTVAELYPHAFLLDATMRLLEVKGKHADEYNPRNAHLCHYHDHAAGSECEETLEESGHGQNGCV